jgi:hypothetical protein
VWTSTRASGDIELFVAYEGFVFRVPTRTGALVDITSYDGVDYQFSTLAEARWRVAQFGDLMLLTNWYDDIQSYSLFEGGDLMPLSDDAPKAKYIAVVRDFPVVAYTNDDVDGEDAYQVRWPGFTDGLPDPTNWERDAATQADSQRLADVGAISGLTGGEFGTVVGEGGVVRMDYGSLLYQFSTAERRIGSRVPNSVNQYRQLTAFWSPEGWAAFDGSAVRMIGAEKIDRWFAEDFDETQASKMWSAVETGRGHMLWAYCGRGHAGKPNRLLRWSVALDEWAVSDIELDALGPGKTFGATLDDDALFGNLDAFTGNLDDDALWASFPQTVAVAGGFVSGFTGAPLTATFETPEFQAGGEDGNRAILRRAMMLHEGGAAELTLNSRQRFDRPGTWGAVHPVQADGWLRFREPGRSHRARVSLSGDWQTATGLDLFGEPIGKR